MVNTLGIKIPFKYNIHGIDVSHHNGKIDWNKVQNMTLKRDDINLAFAFIKATEGVTLSDKKFKQNWEALKETNITKGAYHFYIAWRDPVGQANNFIKNVKLEEGDLAPVLDIEQNSLKSDKKIIEEIGTWLKIVENHYDKKPIIYTNPNFYKKFIKGNYDDYPLWIADYSNQNLSNYSSNLYFWQHNQNGYCNGINGTVDYNVFLGNKTDFEDLCL
ncbi:MAG: glycoside hydrolase [Pseudarcicella sp.]|nr:glycoside hydrolase [Pseudarcicella sp.]MBP6411395.1 glycoside hydrolase [Pseudarcicella sp.]